MTQCIREKAYEAALLAATILMVGVVAYAAPVRDVRAQTATSTPTSTVAVQMEKKWSGPEKFAADQFSFRVSGEGVDEIVELSGDEDIANGTIELAVGTYTVTEIAPDGLDPDTLLVGWWSNPDGLCEDDDENDEDATLTVTDRHVLIGGLSCQADNQYQPAKITVTKEIVGTTTSPALFSFQINGEDAIPFDAGGANIVEVGVGEYEVTEVDAPGYTVSYSDGCTGTLEYNDGVTCIITNTFIEDEDNNGGGDTDDETYRIEGIVWHDEDEDQVLDEDEDRLEGWTVVIANTEDAEDTDSTTTDENGHYAFEVAEGVFEVSQGDLPGEWFQTAPDDPDTYTVTVPIEGEEEMSIWWSRLRYFIETAHAAVVETYSGYDFGNALPDSGGGGNNGDDNDGGGGGNNDDDNDDNDGSSGSSSRSSGGGDDDDDDPDGLVAGEQTSVIPRGAANAGAGGAASWSVWHWLMSLF